ncbi:MAG: hypothetical protein ABJA94_06150 [Rhodoglobus sp.]
MSAIVSRFSNMRALVNMSAAARNDEGIALLSAILFMVLMAGISVVLVSVVLAQSVPSNIAQKSTKTIYAAQAGMQTALAIIRGVAAAPDFSGQIYGNPAQLPCTLGGQVNAQADGVKYAVTIHYFDTDPTQQTKAWQNDSHNWMTCTAGSGLTTTPHFAIIISAGQATGVPNLPNTAIGDRTLQAIYTFDITNVNIPGGRIYDFQKQYCLHAVTASAGSAVKFLATAQCTTDGAELWIYDTDYEIKLASSLIGGGSGLCITGPVTSGGATQQALLQTCKAKTDAGRWNQLWSWAPTGTDNWQGQNQNISAGASGNCLATGYGVGTALTGKFLQVALGGTACNGSSGTFAPSTQVGAGAASYGTHQIVNYLEFGRCADVTLANINYGYMISYPCKQDPTGTGNNLQWNHKWYYVEPALPATSVAGQQISVFDNSNTKYCLTTPTAGSYPVFKTCSSNNSNVLQQWTRYGKNTTNAASYLLVDTNGRCLAVNQADLYSGLYSKLVVTNCDGTDGQKWNAPSTSTESTLEGFKEVG